ncbi:nuclear transport factor 2 family protein [Streptomyces bobili]|uniref:nuclear transport factor 2 family protein n=1 Tax=Streptomyces bobili TaxID=67280 RepID=UPI0033B24A27
MTTTDTPKLTAQEIVERNLRVVAAHFHNENPKDIDKAIDLYGDTIVWEVPARGVLLRDKGQVREAYLKIFDSYQIHKMTAVRRFGAGNFVTDDSIAELTLVGDVANNVPNCPFPAGTEVSMRIVHIFELDDDGKIIRENGYELWRRLDGPIHDDIPSDAHVETF